MPPSVKAHHSKSRTGCLRCKAKKIKCDERKPGCARCEDRAFPCPGYALNVRWSQKHMRAENNESITTSCQNVCQIKSSVLEQSTPASSCPPLLAPRGSEEQLDPCLALSEEWDLDLSSRLDWGETAFLSLDNPLLALVDTSPASSSGYPWDVTGSLTDNTKPVETLTKTKGRSWSDQIPPGSTGQMAVHNDSLSFTLTNTSPQELFHVPTALSEYFFREVITLYCAWDSESNAMRSIVKDMWQSSSAMQHTIQSMAAACLSEAFPHLSSVAVNEHFRALECLQDTAYSLAPKEGILLTYMLLGHTSSWLHPQNLATDLFRASRSMLDEITSEGNGSTALSFFSDTMDYWAMLLVYLTGSQHLDGYRPRLAIGPADHTQTIEPHPYSGISREMVRLLTDTGTLIFQYRTYMATVKFMTEEDLTVFRAALREARHLEKTFLAHRSPQVSQIKDPGDPQTPVEHLRLIDEAYLCTGLLQLYRVFPDLLNERYAPWNPEQILTPLPAQTTPTAAERDGWLTQFAMHILGILRLIPFESRTRSVQPFILVALSSELRRMLQQPFLGSSAVVSTSTLTVDLGAIDVVRARQFVSSRLAAYTHILPLRKIQLIFELVKSVWSALDAGEPDVYWLDVAREKNLGTMMG